MKTKLLFILLLLSSGLFAQSFTQRVTMTKDLILDQDDQDSLTIKNQTGNKTLIWLIDDTLNVVCATCAYINFYPTSSSLGGSVDSSIYATHYYVNNTDSVGTIIKGVWNGTDIDTSYISNLTPFARAQISALAPLSYNSTTGVISADTTDGATHLATQYDIKWINAASNKHISYPDSVSIGSFGSQSAKFNFTGHSGIGIYTQIGGDPTYCYLYNSQGGSYYGGISTSGYTTVVGNIDGSYSYLIIDPLNSFTQFKKTDSIELAETIIFKGSSTASDTDHYTTLGDVHNKFEGKDSLSHMIIEFVQTGASAPTYTIRENTSPYTITATGYGGIGAYTVDFNDGICVDCFDVGKYYIRTQTFWSSGGAVPISCMTFPALNSGYVLNLYVSDFFGTTMDGIGEPFSIELVWYHEQP